MTPNAARNVQKLTEAQPSLSARQPPATRDSAPSKGPREVGWIDVGEVGFGQQCKAGRVTGKRTEGAEVKPAHVCMCLKMTDCS